MPTVTYNGDSFSCTKAVKGTDYISLYDDGVLAVKFGGVVDFSKFTISDGDWSAPDGVEEARATATLNGGILAITTNAEVGIGTVLKFKAPCACSSVTAGVTINGVEYTIVDATGNNMTGPSGGAWASDALVSLMLDAYSRKRYILNSAVSDSYTKEQTLCAETKQLLGLGDDAVPDDALAKIPVASSTFKDVTTGKLYNVETEVRTWGERTVSWFGESSENPIGVFVQVPGSMYRYKNKLLVVGLYSANSEYTDRAVIIDTDTGEILAQASHSRSTDDSPGNISPGNYAQSTCTVDGALAVVRLAGGYSSLYVDMEYNIIYQKANSSPMYSSGWFTSDNYWGYLGYNENSYTIYYAPRGSTSFSQKNVGFSAQIIGISGDIVWMLSSPSNQTPVMTMTVNKFVLSSGTFTSGLHTLSFGNIQSSGLNSVSWNVALSDDNYAYVHLACSTYNYSSQRYEYRYCTKIVKISLTDGSNNFSDLAWGDFPVSEIGNSMFIRSYYIGSIGVNAYYLSGTTGGVYNKETDTLSVFTIDNTNGGQYKYSNIPGRYDSKETLFNIPGAEGIIISGCAWFDTVKKIVLPVVGRSKPMRFQNSNVAYLTDTYSLSVADTYFGGDTIADASVVGIVDMNMVIGGKIGRVITGLVECTE